MSAKKYALPTWLIIFTIILSSCGAMRPIRIGFAANLTGTNPAIGVDGRNGAQVAAAKINAEGGINGHPIELVIRDGLGTKEGSIEAAKQLIEEKALIIIGHMTSSMMLAVWDTTKDSGALYLSPTTSSAELTGLDDNFLRLTPSTAAFAEGLAAYAADKLEARSFAILYDTDNNAFTDTYRAAFTQKMEICNCKVILEYGFSSSSTPDFAPLLDEIKNKKPDAVLIIASASDTALIAQKIRLSGCHAQFLTSNWALTKDLIENGGTAVDDMIAVATYDEGNIRQEYREFKLLYEERFGSAPSFSAGYAYEAVMVLANALKKTDGKKEGLKKALLQTEKFPGVFGEISLDQYGDAQRTLYLVAVKDGRFVTQHIFPAP